VGVEPFQDAVIGCIPAPPSRVHDLHAVVVALGQIVLGNVEHEHDDVAGLLSVAAQALEQSGHGPGAVPPPSVGTSAPDVVAVHHDHRTALLARSS
jgi:hypothetical protein